MDAEEATDGGPFGVGEDGVRGLSCPRRPEEGFTTVTFAPLEETRGQEEASKLSHSLTFLQLLVQQPPDIKAFMPL